MTRDTIADEVNPFVMPTHTNVCITSLAFIPFVEYVSGLFHMCVMFKVPESIETEQTHTDTSDPLSLHPAPG